MKYNGYEVCRAELRSVTHAQKAQKALTSSAIPCQIVRLQGSSGQGCSYGIEIPCNQCSNASALLSSAGVTVKQWKHRD